MNYDNMDDAQRRKVVEAAEAYAERWGGPRTVRTPESHALIEALKPPSVLPSDEEMWKVLQARQDAYQYGTRDLYAHALELAADQCLGREDEIKIRSLAAEMRDRVK